jgi:GNAT superfamily N-acetyltransferase
MTARPTPRGAAAARGIVQASEADIKVLSQVIADAFLPLAPCQWLIPDEAARREIFPSYFRMYVEHAMTDGMVHTTPGRDAAALWIPLGTGLPDPPAGYHQQLAEITGPWAPRFTAFDASLDAHHLTGTEHHHLAILAVRPARQGHGTGTALLDFHHAVLDQQRITAYLEASDQRTRRLYLRHGYADHGTAPIHLHDGPLPGSDRHEPGPPAETVRMYPMVRRPRPGTRSQPARRNAR